MPVNGFTALQHTPRARRTPPCNRGKRARNNAKEVIPCIFRNPAKCILKPYTSFPKAEKAFAPLMYVKKWATPSPV